VVLRRCWYHLPPEDVVVTLSAIDPGSELPAAREIVRQTDPNVALFDVRTLREIVDG
jgi:hypothetical protein